MSATTHNCQCGIRKPANLCPHIWIKSPRTGKVIQLSRGWWHELPPRLASRIVAASAVGRHELEFTGDELRAVAEIHGKYILATTPRPYVPTVRSGKYSRFYSGR